MTLFDRALAVFRIRASGALDKLENPAVKLRAEYNEKLENTSKVVRSAVELRTSVNTQERLIALAQVKLNDYETAACTAFSKGREDLARQLLEQRAVATDELALLEENYTQLSAMCDQVESSAAQFLSDTKDFRETMQARIALYNAAKSQNDAIKQIQGLNTKLGVSPGGSAISDVQKRTYELLDNTRAMVELPEALRGTSGVSLAVDEVHALARSTRVDEQLKQLATLGTLAPDAGAQKSLLR